MNRILFVDDDKNMQRLIARTFADQNYDLEFADNGKNALSLVSTFKPDLVLLDINMPGMDGYEICHRLKSDSQTSGVMVLFQSARIFVEDRLRGYEVGADDYITKPYKMDELHAKIKILLRLKNAQDDLKIINTNLENLVKKKTKALIKKERLAIIGQLVHGIVHNLQNPVTVFKGMVNRALKTVQELPECAEVEVGGLAAKIEQHLNVAVKSADKVELLIHNLLTKGRNESSDSKHALDLNNLIQKEIHFFNADLQFKDTIQKRLVLDDTLPYLLGTYVDFSQICANMIKNALDAMNDSPQKEITVITRHDEDMIYIEFQDTGAGISLENQERIFDPFFTTKQTIDSEEKKPKGTGLGLYTCLEIVKSYAGEILISSQMNKGTTFTIAIPKKDQTVAPPSLVTISCQTTHASAQ